MNFLAARLGALLVWLAIGLSMGPAMGQESFRSRAQLYFFTSPTCGPCRQVEPAIHQLAREGYPVTSINCQVQQNWVQQFQVTRTPTVIVVADRRVVQRHSGFVDYGTMKRWLDAYAPQDPPRPTPPAPVTTSQVRQSEAPTTPADSAGGSGTRNSSRQVATGASSQPLPDTVHRGTERPATSAEQRAMAATVRLRVEDPEGISFATGTIIHVHNDESLVLTCGHVFRDSGGRGRISAEFGFAGGSRQSVPGQLIAYDADNRDIALVAIRTGNAPVKSVPVAQPSYPVQRSDEVFSIGCDHGEDPTIRRTRIKNLAQYNGVNKYDIYGRPVDGRSGGGLFTPGGQLIGVCNAAAVDFDEGVYVALDTIHWQIAQAGLQHIFTGPQAIARNEDLPELNRDEPLSRADVAGTFAVNPDFEGYGSQGETRSSATASAAMLNPVPRSPGGMTPVVNRDPRTPAVTNPAASDLEMIVILRSKSDPRKSQTFTIDQPSEALISGVHKASMNVWDKRPNRFAQLRQSTSGR